MQQHSEEYANNITTLASMVHKVTFILEQHGRCSQAAILSYLLEHFW